MSGSLNIAAIQFNRDGFDWKKNVSNMKRVLEAVSGADAVCLPEVWAGAVSFDEAMLDEVFSMLAKICREKNFTLLTGGLFIRDNGIVKDICHVIGPDGAVVCEQEKIFPSAAVGERSFASGGESVEIFEIAGVKCAAAICVDIFYPEITREMAHRGAQLIFNPANIPGPRNELWKSIVRTRAGENTVYVCYVNNTGTEYADGRAVAGGSACGGPGGDFVFEAGEREEVIETSLDIEFILEQRKRWQYLRDAGERFGTDVFKKKK